MYINVIYSDRMPFWRIKRKSKSFFSGTAYTERNHVFTHSELDNVFSLDKCSIHIHIENDDKVSQNLVNEFLQYLFGKKLIGVRLSNSNSTILLRKINYVLV